MSLRLQLLCLCMCVSFPALGVEPLEAKNLRCEYRVDPLGIDVLQPRLSWIVDGPGRDRHATAYEILVADTEAKLNSNEGGVWNSGKTSSNASTHIVYGGQPLTSEMQCWWKVRVWNENDEPGPWSAPAHWSMGLLKSSDWKGKWIGYDAQPPHVTERPAPIDLSQSQWYNSDGGDNTIARRVRGSFDVPKDSSLKRVGITLSAGNQFTLYVNGQEIGSSDGRFNAFLRPKHFDLTPHVVQGTNVVAIESAPGTNAPAVIGKIRVDGSDNSTRTIDIDHAWKGTAVSIPNEDWIRRDYDDSSWKPLTQTVQEGKLNPSDGILKLPPAPYLRKEFPVDGEVSRATLYVSALGLYEVQLNGAKVTDDVLAPGWTDYNKRVYYRTYDVTDTIRNGANALGVTLAPGWYSGYLGWDPNRAIYGEYPRVLMQLNIHHPDGTTSTVNTDESWRAAFGPVTQTDLYMGESYDARAEIPGWTSADFDDADWESVNVDWARTATIEAHPSAPVRRIKELPAKQVTEPQPGVYVVDLGQNMVGWIRLKVTGNAGQTVTIRHAEMLNPDGTIYVANLRAVEATDAYTLRGGGEETWEPRFTFHGFRYVELHGYPGTPETEDVTGVVVHSDMASTGAFECSNPLLNQLQSNIVWGQRGNFVDIPTDCPQRDERMGWLGDAQVFCQTACFNMDASAFFTKWMKDVVDTQFPNGAFAMVAPRIADVPEGPAGWGDAGVIVPWTIYETYGDRRILETHYDEMKAFIEYMHSTSEGHIRNDKIFGDWLHLGRPTPTDLISTAFFAYSTRLVAEMADALGRSDDATKYRELHDRIRDAFIKAFVKDDGHVEGDTQTGYVLALHFDLVPEQLRDKTAAHLVEAITRENLHITTGFLGSPYITHVLSDTGHMDTAYALLLQDTFPSWLYPVTQGATTIWERWDGWRDDAGFQDPKMNSFNHYAYGAIGDWMYRTILGIQPDPEFPGYARAVIRPRPGGGLTFAKGHFDSMHGRYSSEWRIEGGQITIQVSIPPNTRATVFVLTSDPSAVEADGLTVTRRDANAAVFDLGSGTYTFHAPL